MKKETNISKKRTRIVYTEPLSLGKLYYSSRKEVLPSKHLLKIPFLCLRLHRSMILVICSATKRATRAILDDLLSDITCLFLYSTCPFIVQQSIELHFFRYIFQYIVHPGRYNFCPFVSDTPVLARSYLLLSSIHSYTQQSFGPLLIPKKSFLLKICHVQL